MANPSPYAGTSPVASLAHAGGAVTLVEGSVRGIRTGDHSIAVEAHDNRHTVEAPDWLEVIRQPRPPLTAAVAPDSGDDAAENTQ